MAWQPRRSLAGSAQASTRCRPRSPVAHLRPCASLLPEAFVSATIPAIAHFVWSGAKLPAVAWLAMRAALDRADLDVVRLHHTDAPLAQDPLVRDLCGRPGFELVHVHPVKTFALGLDAAVERRLEGLLGHLPGPAARSDVLRLCILWSQGGIYLDTDAITLQPLRPLCGERVLCGLERVCLPSAVVHSRSPARWLRAGLLLGAREICTRLPQPDRAFALIEQHYDLACNNAVLGAPPRHPGIELLLRAAASLPEARAMQLYELGPRLLEGVTANAADATFDLQPPHVFYPLAPEVCALYVKEDPSATLDGRAVVAHLYDSVLARRVGSPLDAAWFARTGRSTLLGRLVAPWLDDLQRAIGAGA